MSKAITADQLAAAFINAEKILRSKKHIVNNLNVFPVPDGDTGTNMTLTLQEVVKSIKKRKTFTMESLANTIGEASLMGARGNSGVILSQFIGGFCSVVSKKSLVTNQVLCEAFQEGTHQAYSSVSSPVEGTILTVMSSATKAIQKNVSKKDIEELIGSAIHQAQFTLKKTPEMLPKLKDAGVVDSGGAGFLYFLEGIYESLYPNQADRITATDDFTTPQLARVWEQSYGALGTGGIRSLVELNYKAIKETFKNISLISKKGFKIVTNGKENFSPHKAYKSITIFANQLKLKNIKDTNKAFANFLRTWYTVPKERYCYEVILTGVTKDLDTLRKNFEKLGSSLIVAKQGDFTKIHIHIVDKDSMTKKVEAYGRIKKIKVDDIHEQHKEFVSHRENGDSNNSSGTVIVAVINGKGFKELYESFDGVHTLDGGATMNPSIGQFKEIFESIDDSGIIILPNNNNVFLTAQNAAAKAASSSKQIKILHTTDQAQGLGTILNFNKELTLNENYDVLENAFMNIETFSVVKASKDSIISQEKVKKGNYIALSNSTLLASDKKLDTTIIKALQSFDLSSKLVTLYHGATIDESVAEKLKESITKEFNVEIQLYSGGQKHYDYIVSVE